MNKKMYSIEELIDKISMPVVAYSGGAKSFLREALEYAKNKEYKKAELTIQESKNSIAKAHETHRAITKQLRFNKKKLEEITKPKGIPIEIINTIDYGTMNGEKVLKITINSLNSKSSF
ncbi:PTS lactose/cellobiose transporter subunit IIA [Borreliella lusitaniae]|uniref:PTS lactose/cellobiose transporter subunit IIA n=1 Tax=Borreliella lusitaniae TaxID=100177 RepID=UPI0029301B10|nr:PTS lactose/cellobiose transporter subunit IIA [Borreliella lusitaniae]WNY67208.1 PTS lactose/cellobiose transporter subunit IIA [Borreliella lusitaniae]